MLVAGTGRQARTTNGTQVAATAGNDDLVAAAERVLARSETGAGIVRSLHEHDVEINLVPDAEFYRKYNDGTGGFFDPRTGKITAPVGSMVDPVQGAIMLAHEGTHAVDSFSMPGGRFGQIGWGMLRSVGAAIAAPFHLQNPATVAVDSNRSHAVDDEVRAYMTQARVEDELDIRSLNLADFGHNADGSLATTAETRHRIEEESIYQERGTMRTVRAGAFSMLLGLGSAEAVHIGASILGRKVPVLPLFSTAVLLAAGMTAADWATHRDQ